MIEIFESKYGIDDLSVWGDETNIESMPYKYNISIEGLIWYNTLNDGIDYYKTLLKEYEEFIINNVKLTDEDVEDVEYKNDIIYRSYDIDISQDENGYVIYVQAPVFYNLNDTYLWFKGVVNQLEGINKNNNQIAMWGI